VTRPRPRAEAPRGTRDGNPGRVVSNDGGAVAKELRCGDVMPGCTFVASGTTEEEVLKKAAQHAKDKHNVKELTTDLVMKVKAAIRTK
jgi:predicted small metal-binding protein